MILCNGQVNADGVDFILSEITQLLRPIAICAFAFDAYEQVSACGSYHYKVTHDASARCI